MPKGLTILSIRNKVTANTVRFGERAVKDADSGEDVLVEAVPQLYVTKDALEEMYGTTDVKAVTITIVRADEE